MTSSRIAALTGLSLAGFAANSLLTRGAIAASRIDPASFLAIRIASGALMLWVITKLRPSTPSLVTADPANNWLSALALTTYGIAFTFAYVRLGAGIGALALFGAVQATMIAAGVRQGERPRAADVAGLAIALMGLLALTVPGASRPSLTGVLLMAIAGISWGIYSLRGRRSRDPLTSTAHNFVRTVPFALLVLATQWSHAFATRTGVILAMISGAVTSGIAYAIWYSVLPRLTAWRAALVQLMTPVLTAVAAVVILGESMSTRTLISGALIVSGVLLSIAAPKPRA